MAAKKKKKKYKLTKCSNYSFELGINLYCGLTGRKKKKNYWALKRDVVFGQTVRGKERSKWNENCVLHLYIKNINIIKKIFVLIL